jgi:FAD/FMN-containing dehydrogenase
VTRLSSRPFLVHAHAGNGIVWIHAAKGAIPDASGIGSVGLDGVEGRVAVRRCPPAWKSSVPVWGRETGDRALMRHVKATLDPKNVFNPGRFV